MIAHACACYRCLQRIKFGYVCFCGEDRFPTNGSRVVDKRCSCCNVAPYVYHTARYQFLDQLEHAPFFRGKYAHVFEPLPISHPHHHRRRQRVELGTLPI